MLKIFRSLKGLNKAQLLIVYEQSIRQEGKQRYPSLPDNLQCLRAEEDFCAFLDLFLADKQSIYAVWAPDGVYRAALRIEAYRDGFLLSGLETALEGRHKGYATALIKETQKHLSELGPYKLYSHVGKANTASLHVHRKCGFIRVLEHAEYVDGSVFHNVCTLCYEG
jgi:GNAT superfamily N-acetyltransferase